MKRNELVTFHPVSRDRETLPCFPVSSLGQPLECQHQSGTMRLLRGDRVRIEELRGDYALVSHAGLKGGVLLVSLNQLEPIPVATPQAEDAHL